MWYDKGSRIERVEVDYFEGLFASEEGDPRIVTREVKSHVTFLQNDLLLAPFTVAEIKAVVFSMHLKKSPKGDGFSLGFFQMFWGTIEDAVMGDCLKWIKESKIPKGLNATTIVLIPKKLNPMNMGELCPISLCNVIYKIMFKAIANWLKQILLEVV